MMKRNFKLVFMVVCMAWTKGSGWAGESTRSLTLQETILLARTQSIDAAVALNELKTSYWEHRIFQANLLPEVNFRATLPYYNKSYNTYQQSDGSYTFVRSNSLKMAGSFSVDQSIWATGGTLSLKSSMEYLKQLTSGGEQYYMTVPVSLTLSQPLFGINYVKWNRRIEPLRYEESKAKFITATEQVTMQAITYFFNYLLAVENVGINHQNLENAEKLYKVAEARREMGQISENELLQLRLNLLNARANLTDAQSNCTAHKFRLLNFLGLDEQLDLQVVLPEEAPQVDIQYEDVLDKALAHNSFAQNIRRRQIEADYSVASAKGNLRSIDLYASVGFTGKDSEISPAYQYLKDTQVVEVGVKVPILDWGKRRARVRVAESDREVTRLRIRREEMNFNQDIFLLVANFNNQAQQLLIATEADEVAQNRYKTSIETFLIGKISTLDLSDAQVSKDEARKRRITQLYNYWYYFYQLRSVSLWDFEKNTTIDADFEEIIRRR